MNEPIIAAIESEMHAALEWEELPDKKESHVFIRRYDTDAADRGKWPEQHQWLAEKLEAFHQTLSGRVKELDTTAAAEPLGMP